MSLIFSSFLRIRTKLKGRRTGRLVCKRRGSWTFGGRYRRLIEAADAAVGETEAVYRDAMVLLNAEVANAYIEIRSLEAAWTWRNAISTFSAAR